ncbi:type II toxin-antitoxin system prevent-host-death family antitoxin [Pseudomonas sp. MAFF 301449]|uniref:Type II toxin-antitoxin system prevent-host-death family antitoxin n=1 Tax=Pseudomonas cyclaminis TaxID=2781239 RepID=A0ABR9SMD2_9PSED|nr:type II toxin-antitoxin system prevent-host-death family antitoxin [Pseudomonas cyclaminis]MBE8589581.1 type II toxin-antitoxin system prevent-host-death family antitoxin [Pseudomonas cyclaminis]MBE8598747.1 type II toxin-antitoxin system prevent-host-death family antitoxin [Pseudomonas cyclaminis]
MLTTVSCSQARRRLRRLIALVAQGHSFVITKNGRAICRLEGAEAIQVDHGASCKASL